MNDLIHQIKLKSIIHLQDKVYELNYKLKQRKMYSFSEYSLAIGF